MKNVPRVPRQYDRPCHRDHAQRGALFRRVRGLAAGQQSEIDRGLWTVTGADLDTIFRKDTDGLWEELHQQSRRIRAVRRSNGLALLR